MKTNPILNFRYAQEDKSVSNTDIDRIEFNKDGLENQATMITKTREAIDSSEISMMYETMQDSFHFE